MKVLLLNPPYARSSGSPLSKTGANLPPLGLLSIAAYLRERVDQVDVNVIDAASEILTIDRLETVLESGPDYDVIGITVYATTLAPTIETIHMLTRRFPKALLVAGGAHASSLPKECIERARFHVAIVGEGEEPFSLLVQKIQKGESYFDVPGIVCRQTNGERISTDRPQPLDLAHIPFPARDLIDMTPFHPALGTYKRLPAVSLITSRGCPYQCSFCSKSVFGSTYRSFPASRVIEEMEHVIARYGAREIIFYDDSFTVQAKRVHEICDSIIEKKWDITWVCSTRVNLVTPELLKKMKRAGCVSIGFGVETATPELLRQHQKGIHIDAVRNAIRWTKEAGIEVRAFYLLGLPGETRESIEKTIRYAMELNADFVVFCVAAAIPGTRLYEEAKQNGTLLVDGLELYARLDGSRATLRYPNLTTHELEEIQRTVYRRYYLRPRYILSYLMRLRSWDEVKRLWNGAIAFSKWMLFSQKTN